MGSLLDKVKKILSNGSNRGKTMTGEPKEPIIINPTVKNESVINKENEHDRSTSSVVEEGISGSRSCGCGRGQKGCSGSCGCSSQGGSSCGKGSCSCEGSSEEAGTQAEESVTEAEVKVRAPLYREIRKPKKDTPLSVRAHAALSGGKHHGQTDDVIKSEKRVKKAVTHETKPVKTTTRATLSNEDTKASIERGWGTASLANIYAKETPGQHPTKYPKEPGEQKRVKDLKRKQSPFESYPLKKSKGQVTNDAVYEGRNVIPAQRDGEEKAKVIVGYDKDLEPKDANKQLPRRRGQKLVKQVMYKGPAQALLDVAGGHTEFGMMPLSVAAPMIKSGKVKLNSVIGRVGQDACPAEYRICTSIVDDSNSCRVEIEIVGKTILRVKKAKLALARVPGEGLLKKKG